MQTRPANANRPFQATGLVLGAMLAMGLVDNFVVVIAETAGLWQFQVLRSTMCLVLLGVFAFWRGARLRPRRWLPVLARSAVLSFALILYFAALAFLPISEAVAGLFTAPVFVALLSNWVFGHRLSPLRLSAAVIGFVGVVMVLRPDAGSITVVSFLPVVAGFFYAIGLLATREWCEGESASALLAAFFAAMLLWGFIGLCVLALADPVVPEGAQGFVLRGWGEMSGAAWIWTVAQAVFACAAIGAITRAYQIAEAAYVAVFEYTLLVSAVMWAWLLFGDGIDVWARVGIAAILAGGAILSVANRGTEHDQAAAVEGPAKRS